MPGAADLTGVNAWVEAGAATAFDTITGRAGTLTLLYTLARTADGRAGVETAMFFNCICIFAVFACKLLNCRAAFNCYASGSS
jgi:hypothetical protein